MNAASRTKSEDTGTKAEMLKRRLSCPQTVQHMWDAIVCVRQQKQIPNLERIANYMRRKHGLSQADLDRQLNYALRDGLVKITRKVGCKGSKTGVEQEGYRLPDAEIEKDDHDWYCFECHRGGEVIPCTSCHRVYHSFCVKDTATLDHFVCAICTMCKSKNYFKMKKSDLNMFLGYTCNRLKEKVSEEQLSPKTQRRGIPRQEQTRDLHRMPHTEEEKWRHDLLLFHPMDLNTMEEKALACQYKRLEEFQADAQNIVHNIVIYFGVHSPMADMARQMLRDCIYDLGEIRQCRDCYHMSNEKKDKFWFCQPCDPPHELVYAKQKGFPYWPAKVIRKTNGVYDVRFFGGYHQRANIEKDHIKPISTNIHSLAIKRTAAWNRACEELRRHQELLEKQKKEARSSKSVTMEHDSDDSSHEEELKKEERESEAEGGETEAEASHDESSISSSSKTIKQFKQAPTPEDYNVVSSSSQEATTTKVSVATQTFRRMLSGRFPSRAVQTDIDPPATPAATLCKCTGKCSRQAKERLEEEFRESKEHALKELTENLQREFEERKQQAISAALASVQKDIDKGRKEIEEKLQKDHQQELEMLTERNRQAISETKKKQWCYNCEAEAIYHCCWNTSYCSIECQQVHWQKEHKRNCRQCGIPVVNTKELDEIKIDVIRYPWLVQIRFREQILCGGSIIDKSWILTSAHCLKLVTNHQEVEVIAGIQYFNKSVRLQPHVAKIIVHKKFDNDSLQNDIALLELDNPLEYNNGIQPICLSLPYNYEGLEATVAGWGRTTTGPKNKSNILEMEATQYVIPISDCQKKLVRSINSNQLCTSEPLMKKSACKGDAGTPLFLQCGKQYIQLGVTSWGIKRCISHYPTVYADVSKYKEWIKNFTKISDLCFRKCQQ